MSYELCREVYDALLPNNPLSSSCMCTAMFENSGNVCNADSGGPAVVEDSVGAKVVVGVLAWGMSPCSNPSIPSVWSSVGVARNWIDAQIASNPPPS
jgi:secreted trypsin-like serine protease